jgi:HEAT repeat protein
MGEGEKKRREMEKKNREELVSLLKALRRGALSPRETYRAIQAFGEMNFQEARPEVEGFLKSEDPELRFVSLKVLTLYWHLEEYWETAREILEHDPDEDCRFRAAAALADLKQDTQDRQTLQVLARVVRNEQEELVVREAAYAAMKAVLHFDPHEQFHTATRSFDLDKEADWEMVDSYL